MKSHREGILAEEEPAQEGQGGKGPGLHGGGCGRGAGSEEEGSRRTGMWGWSRNQLRKGLEGCGQESGLYSKSSGDAFERL